MARWGKVVGGHFMNATIDTNRKGELALQLSGAAAFKRRPTLTADTVAAWEEGTRLSTEEAIAYALGVTPPPPA